MFVTEGVQKFILNDTPEQKSEKAAGLDMENPVTTLSDFHSLRKRRSGGLS
jgi:hypothetical protein